MKYIIAVLLFVAPSLATNIKPPRLDNTSCKFAYDQGTVDIFNKYGGPDIILVTKRTKDDVLKDIKLVRELVMRNVYFARSYVIPKGHGIITIYSHTSGLYYYSQSVMLPELCIETGKNAVLVRKTDMLKMLADIEKNIKK